MRIMKFSAGRRDWFGTSRPTRLKRSTRLAHACLPIETLEDRLLFSAYTVTSLADDGSAGTLRWAVNQANQSSDPSNTINFQSGLSGTISLTGGELELTGGDTAIDGPGAGALMIDGMGMNSVFRVDFGATAELSGMTITDGASIIGAGLDNSGTITAQDCVFSNNVAAGGVGGAIFSSGAVTLLDCSFSNNSASSGGGIYCNSGTLDAGGCTFDGNSTDTSGGAIYTDFTTDFIDNSTFTANTSAQGGAVFLNSGTLTMANDTIFGNTAQSDGGGLHVEPGAEAMLYNTILAGNLLTDGVTESDLTGTLDQALAAGQSASSNNLIGATVNLDLGALTGNGGATETMALMTGSVALDAGSNALAVDWNGAALATDQRGMGFARLSGTAVDIGAYEFQVQPPPPPPTPPPTPSDSLTVASVAGVTGKQVKLSATLLDSSGEALADKKVTFMINGVAVGHGKTNAHGVLTETVCLKNLTPGVYATGITASFAGDAADAAVSGTGALTVTDAPIKTHDKDVCLNGNSASASVLFTQDRAGALATDYTATIDFGDGSGPAAASIVSVGCCRGEFKVSLAHTYAPVTVKTTYIVTITITSMFGATTTVTEKVTVKPPPPPPPPPVMHKKL